MFTRLCVLVLSLTAIGSIHSSTYVYVEMALLKVVTCRDSYITVTENSSIDVSLLYFSYSPHFSVLSSKE